MKQLLSLFAGTLLLGAALMPLATAQAEQPAEMKIAAPELKEVDEWINSKPLQLKDVRGKVVVLHFWTFG
jgi:membrane protein insertase Oxa1/YidC/SpoIIIJ